MTTNTGDLPAVTPVRAAGAHRRPARSWWRDLATNIWAVLTGRV